jgi:hypothetical protein
MTEKEQEILDLYLKDLRKKIIIIAFIIVCVIVISAAFAKKYLTQNNENIVSNENIIEEITTNDVSNDTKVENITKTKEENQTTEETNTKVQKQENKEENTKQESISSSNKQTETKTEQVSSKPANKDFLFTDGYTMENVTQAAQDYLTSSGHAGECTPIKDNEGIYLGMRVTFY